MSPGFSTESYPAFARIGLRENPGKNLNQRLPLLYLKTAVSIPAITHSVTPTPFPRHRCDVSIRVCFQQGFNAYHEWHSAKSFERILNQTLTSYRGMGTKAMHAVKVNSTDLVSIVRSRNMFAFSSDERAFNMESYFRTALNKILQTNCKNDSSHGTVIIAYILSIVEMGWKGCYSDHTRVVTEASAAIVLASKDCPRFGGGALVPGPSIPCTLPAISTTIVERYKDLRHLSTASILNLKPLFSAFVIHFGKYFVNTREYCNLDFPDSSKDLLMVVIVQESSSQSTMVQAIRSNNKLSQWRPIYSGVRQGCGLSPILFIIYINRIIQDWRQTRHGFIPINRNLQLDALLFADDLVLMASTEDDLQYSVHNLNKIRSFVYIRAIPSQIARNIDKIDLAIFKYNETFSGTDLWSNGQRVWPRNQVARVRIPVGGYDSKHKKRIVYPVIRSAILPVPHGPDVPITVRLENLE
ncbi:hypothetical protein ANN_05988 [Periplaneta americana]|uniref:Reverse transcriptase domain-containing protein n=1 Tax=Periplaneta americana TaxID=6978 RepID=A0ABQ8TE37_PERAM|nr:hypothetical protein ANN_05988 [Periplaneta americana]